MVLWPTLTPTAQNQPAAQTLSTGFSFTPCTSPHQVDAKLAAGPVLQGERERLDAARPVHVEALAARTPTQHPFGGSAAGPAVDRYILELVAFYYIMLCTGELTWWGEIALLPPGRHGMDVRQLVLTLTLTLTLTLILTLTLPLAL